MNDEEKKLIEEYFKARDSYFSLANQVSKLFMDKAKVLLEADDLKSAMNLVYDCPDSLTSAFVTDLINEYRKNRRKGNGYF